MKIRFFSPFAAVSAAILISWSWAAAQTPPALPGDPGSAVGSSTNGTSTIIPEIPGTNASPTIIPEVPNTSGGSPTVPEVPGDVAPPSTSTNLNGNTTIPSLPTEPGTSPAQPAISNTNRSSNVKTGFVNRADVRSLPSALRERLTELNERPRSYKPQGVYPPLRGTRQLVGFFLLDPTQSSGPSAAAAEAFAPSTNLRAPVSTNLSPQGAARLFQVTSSNGGTNATSTSSESSFADVFTDVAGLPPLADASSRYEGWLIHDLVVPTTGQAGSTGTTAGGITADDATALSVLGTGNNAPGAVFTTDGSAPSSGGSASPTSGTATNGAAAASVSGAPNTISLYVKAGTLTPMQKNDAHAYRKLNPQTSWVTLAGLTNNPTPAAPNTAPAEATVPSPSAPATDPQANTVPPAVSSSGGTAGTPASGTSLIPSGVAREILLDAYVRKASFEPNVTDINQRLSDAYTAQVSKVDTNRDGVISTDEAAAAAAAGTSVFLEPSAFNRFAVSKETSNGAEQSSPGSVILQGTLQAVSGTPPATITDETQE
jgi:hypothetical protein